MNCITINSAQTPDDCVEIRLDGNSLLYREGEILPFTVGVLMVGVHPEQNPSVFEKSLIQEILTVFDGGFNLTNVEFEDNYVFFTVGKWQIGGTLV